MYIFNQTCNFCAKYTKMINKFPKYQVNLNKGLALNKTDTVEGCACNPTAKNLNTSATGTRVLTDYTFHFHYFLC